MASKGQKFELNLDAENWQFDTKEHEATNTVPDVIKEVRERDPKTIPAAPTLKSLRTGFPERRQRKTQSAFRQQQKPVQPSQYLGPSDRAILHHAAKKQGVDLAGARQKSDIDAENRNRLNDMTMEEIEDARSELMAQINPEALRKFLQRATVDDENIQQQKEWDDHELSQLQGSPQQTTAAAFEEPRSLAPQVTSKSHAPTTESSIETPSQHDFPPFNPQPSSSSIHFPAPPRNRADFKPLDPTSDTFLQDLRENYFPDLPHDPNALAWLQDPTAAEDKDSAYNPDRAGFAPSALRFNFNGALIPPSQSLSIPTSKGLHHHGAAPSSAGYTIPELTLLGRSTLASQRCVSHQVMGRILYRLGRGDFGAKGSDMNEGLWTSIERERVLEVIMAEANRDKGHVSARSFATEALWLWRRGGAGDRGILKEGERRAK